MYIKDLFDLNVTIISSKFRSLVMSMHGKEQVLTSMWKSSLLIAS